MQITSPPVRHNVTSHFNWTLSFSGPVVRGTEFQSFKIRRLIDWLICVWVRDCAVTMHLGLNWWALCAHINLCEPRPFTKVPDGPQTYTLNVLWLQAEGARCICLSEAKASHSHRMWAEVSSSAPHLLHNRLSDTLFRWRCLLRVLCPVRRPVTAIVETCRNK